MWDYTARLRRLGSLLGECFMYELIHLQSDEAT